MKGWLMTFGVLLVGSVVGTFAAEGPVLEIVFEAGVARRQPATLTVFPDRRVEYAVDGKMMLRKQIAQEQYGSFLDFLGQKGLPRGGKAVVSGADPKQIAVAEEVVAWLDRRGTKRGAEQEERHERFRALCAETDLATQKDPLLKHALEVVCLDSPKATVRPVQSRNMHLGVTLMPQVVTNFRYYAATLAWTPAAPVRKFLTVSQDGKVAFVELAQVTDHLRQQDRSAWKDDDYLNAARLYVHMTSVANEDGWKLLAKPDDFTGIDFNMESVGPGRDRQRTAAQQIKSPSVTRPAAQKSDVVVTFYSWHLIGGELRKWTVTFADKVSASSENLGAFGGGGYD